LDDSLGLPISEEEPIKTDPALGQNNNLQEAEELLDVVEFDSEEESGDFLAPLKGELQRLHISDVDAERDSTVSVVSQRSNRIGSPKVIEYVRRGTRIAAETVQVVSLNDLLSRIPCSISEADADETISLAQKPIEERFTVFLRILESDLPSVRNISQDYILLWGFDGLYAAFTAAKPKQDRETGKERSGRLERRNVFLPLSLLGRLVRLV